jgi:hypothetical protein
LKVLNSEIKIIKAFINSEREIEKLLFLVCSGHGTE